MSDENERTYVVALRVACSDPTEIGESLERVLDGGTLQEAINEDLAGHDLDGEVRSVILRHDAPPVPEWEELRAAEELPDGRRIMASFAEDRRVKVLPTEAEVEVIYHGDEAPTPGDVLWTFRVLVPEKASERRWVDEMEPAAHPERETDYSRLVEILARAGVPLKSRGLTADVSALGLELRFAASGELEAIRRLPDPMELTLGEAQSLAEWAAESERRGGLTGWGALFDAAMLVARRVRSTCAEVFNARVEDVLVERRVRSPGATRRAVALLVREVLCEQVYRHRNNAALAEEREHVNRSLRTRAVDVEAVAALAGPEVLEMTPDELRAHAALVLDRVSG